MLELLLGAAVRLALLVGAVKLFVWARRREKAARTRWRRRVGLTLFLLPLILWVAELLLPDALQPLVAALRAVERGIDAGLAYVIGKGQQELQGIWRLAVKPMVYAGFYGGAGVLIGWPLDALRARREAREAEAAQQAGQVSEPEAR